MTKKIGLVFLASFIMFACGQQAEQDSTRVFEDKTIEELVSDPMAFEDHEVSFEGLIGHICRHSGDKMRIMQPDNDAFSIMVMLGDFTPVFGPEFEGSDIKVQGVLKTQVRNIEELEDHDHDHEHEEGHACESTEAAIKRLEEKGISPDIMAYIELTSFEIK